MELTTLRDVAAAGAAGAGVLLLADLSLGWHEVRVETSDLVSISTTSSGWTNLGLVAGLLTIAMLLFMIRPLRRTGSVDLLHAAVTAALGVAVAGFTIAAALTGSASITAPDTAVEVGSSLWPAYVGIGIGAFLAAAAVTAFVLVMRGATAPSSAARTAS